MLDEHIKKLIDEFVGILLETYCDNKPILDVEIFVKKIGGTVNREYSDMSFINDGYIRKLKNGPYQFEIKILDYRDIYHRNLLLAKYLGHLFLHMGYLCNDKLWEQQCPLNRQKWNDTKCNIGYLFPERAEEEALYFARVLLLPEHLFLTYYKKYLDGNRLNTKMMADELNLSIEFVANRGVELGLLKNF